MAKKKSLIPLVAISLVLAMSLATFVPMVYAWFVNPTRSEAHVGGNIKGSYFEDGDGSEEHPYIIARPIQIYYLAWLQDIGYFNKGALIMKSIIILNSFFADRKEIR